MRSCCAAVPVLLLSSSALLAQSPALKFEVASVKPSTSGFNGVRGGCHGIDSKRQNGPDTPLGRCVITDGRLSHLIATAWQVPQIGMIRNAPDWVINGAERFNIEAEAENPSSTSEAQLLGMLQSLLIERFQLKFHREEKDLPGFALVAGKNGPKFKETTADSPVVSFGNVVKPVMGAPVTMLVRDQSMAWLANLLSQIGQQGPIEDQTGLAGRYDFRLAWDEASGPTLSTALEEQMGLRLNKTQGVPVSYFVIDSAQRPTPN